MEKKDGHNYQKEIVTDGILFVLCKYDTFLIITVIMVRTVSMSWRNLMIDVKEKGKRSLTRLVFGRAMFFILFTMIQIITLIGVFSWIDERYRAYGYGTFTILGGILAIHILNEKQNASFKMAWLVPVLLFPVFGGLFYMFVQLQMEPKILAKRISDIHSRTKHFLPQNQPVLKKLKKELKLKQK